MPDAISKISQETIQKLKNKSVKGMAANPSEKGASAKQVQDAMTEPYIGEVLSLLTEINRIVTELNSKFTNVDEAITSTDEGLEELQTALTNAVNAIDGYLAQKQDKANLVDNLTTDDATKYLSAKQGKVLKDLADTKQSTANLYDGLDSNDASKYLSAKQGKILKELVDGKNKGITYASISAMITGLNSADNTLLKAYDNVYILDVDVPDFWVKEVKTTSSSYTFTTVSAFISALNVNNYIQVGYYEIAKLETEKVDLSDYQPKGSFDVDILTTEITHTYELNKEKSYDATGITSISLSIPSTIAIGFYSGANFKIGSTAPTFSVTNNSVMPLKLIHLGVQVDVYVPIANTTVTTLVYNDGINTYLQINEVA